MSDTSINSSSEISVEPGSIVQTASSATSQEKRLIVLEDKIKRLTESAKDIEKDFRLLEKQSNKLGNFLIVVTTGVLIALAVLLIPLGVDYFKDSWERYEALKEMIFSTRNDIQSLNFRVDTLEKVK